MKRVVLPACFLAALAALWLAMGPRARRPEVSQAEQADPAEGAGDVAGLVEGVEPRGGRERAAPALGAPAGESGSPSATPAATASGLHVVSALGLPLEHAYVAGADGLEREVALGPDGSCAAPLELPCDVRAVGHRAARVAALGLVALEPVFGLVLRAPALSERAVAADLGWTGPFERYVELQEVMACGFVGEDALAFAIDWERTHASMAEHVTVSFWTTDNRRYDAMPNAGTQGTFEERLELKGPELATLTLTATCPQGCASPSLIELWPDFPRMATVPRQQVREWGVLQIHDMWVAARAAGGDRPARVAVGQEHGASALCPDCGSYGRRLFVAQPGEGGIEIPLDQRAVVLRASVDHVRWDEVRLDWTFERERSGEHAVHEELASWLGGGYFPVASGGTLELRLPDRLPITRGAAWPMPALLRLIVQAAGCEKLVLYVDLPPGGVVDLGPLPLSLPAPHLVLAPGHGIADAQGVTARSAGALLRFGIYHPKDSRPRADGALEICLDQRMSASDPSVFEGESRPAELLVADGQLGVRAFAWDGSAYAPLPAESRSLRIDCSALPEGAPSARFGIRWHGLDHQLGWGAQAGTSKEWSLTWPADAELLWWSLNDPPVFADGRGGTVPLTPALSVLRIPSGI